MPIDTRPVPPLKYGRATDRPLRGPDTWTLKDECVATYIAPIKQKKATN